MCAISYILPHPSSAQPDCSTQDIIIHETNTCYTCFEFVPASGGRLDDYYWVVYNGSSEVCEVSFDEYFCYKTCFRSNYEIAVVARYDNLMYTCTTYKQFVAACTHSDCNPYDPPDEIPAIGLVYVDEHCGGAQLVVKTPCTCVDYQYEIHYTQPADLSIPCVGNETVNRTITMGPCECEVITVMHDGRTGLEEIYVRVTLPAGCCNAAVERCEYIKIDDVSALDVCTNCISCDCSSPGCAVNNWYQILGPCTPDNLIGISDDSNSEETYNLLPLMPDMQDIPTLIVKAELYDINGKLLLSFDQNMQSNQFFAKLQEKLTNFPIGGIYFVRLISDDGSYSVHKIILTRP